MADVLAEIDEASRLAEAELSAVATADALEQYRIKWLGSKGKLKGMMSLIGKAPADQKKAVGQRLNVFKESLESGHYEASSRRWAPRRATTPASTSPSPASARRSATATSS